MADDFTQDGRLIAVETPLGKDVLLLESFRGREELSRLFSFRLEMLSEKRDIEAKDIVGKKVTLSLALEGDEHRHFNGFVSRFSAGGLAARGLRRYRAEVVPWLWFLTRTADCRMFHEKTLKKILEEIFKSDFGFSDFKFDFTGEEVEREYRVQYNETAFDFVSRLMEEEGVFYYFTHEKNKHTMVIANHKGAYQDLPEGEIAYTSGNTPGRIGEWEHGYEFRSGKWSQTDYNYEEPSASLLTSKNTVVKLPSIDKYPVFEYPGGYGKKSDGEEWTRVRMEEDEWPHDVAHGAGGCRTVAPGGKFTLKEHDIDTENSKDYVIIAVEHEAREAAYATGAGDADYGNEFSCIPASVTFRPPRATPRPSVRGPQTAIVTDREVDENSATLGRVKVKFHWSRDRTDREDETCWIRVAQIWAGPSTGAVFIPQVDDEVVVDFIDGDPDRPIVVGSVYHAENEPPEDLVENGTRSGVRTTSQNEIRFEDKDGEEELYVHAERDFKRVVENDEILEVGNERTLTVQAGNATLIVEQGDAVTKVDLGKSTTEAMNSIELKVGESTIKLEQSGVTISGLQVKIKGTAMTEVKAPMTSIKADGILNLKGSLTKVN